MAVPEPVNSRVYIGGLGEQAVVQDLEGLLKDYQFTNYRDLTLLRGFGFVQFHDEQSAQNAIKGLNGKVFGGRKLTVKVANDNRAKKGLLPRGHPLQGPKAAAPAGPLRDRSPIDMPGSGRVEDNALHLLDVAPYATPSFGPSDLSGAYAEAGIPARPLHRAPALPPESNDCEIIVVNKELTAYAESIEARLKRAGMTVDLLFPNNDVPIGKVLTNIASRGSFYAILITPENQERNSITVNVLYGIPAEHRNMPKDDAVMFIINHFTAKNRQERAPMAFPPMNSFHEIAPAAPVPPVPATMKDQPLSPEKHPEAIQNMINLLAANRSLTVLQYERLIKYLSERKEAQIRIELGEDPEDTTNSLISSSAPAAPAAKTKGTTEKELEKKILDILNKPSIVGVAKAANPVEFLAGRKGASTTPLPTCHLLYDPKVQRALDSLLQGQLFMKFTG